MAKQVKQVALLVATGCLSATLCLCCGAFEGECADDETAHVA